MNKNLLIAITIIGLAAVGGGAFYGGMVYGKSQNSSAFNRQNFQSALRNGVRSGATGANFVSGNILSKDSSSITLQLPNNGGSKIIFFSGTTQISKFASGVASDLTTGESVSVTGTTNSDGSVTAQSIQIRPIR